MRAYVSNSIRIAIVLAVVITFLSCIFCGKILHLVNTPADVFDDAYTFLILQFAAIPFTIAYNLLSGQIRALGNSKQPFYFLIAASLVNILLDVVLILIMGLGVEGAGIATWLSQGFSVALCVWYIKSICKYSFRKATSENTITRRLAYCSTMVCLWAYNSLSPA